ncbi:hypothetical protein J2W21_000603 [Sinomonas atrocyanea]|nr:hypothetical protein [Sinomonas atrocyanea]
MPVRAWSASCWTRVPKEDVRRLIADNPADLLGI